MPENVIFGTGPLGLAVARRLAAAGAGIRLVNRSGKADAPKGAEIVAADATGKFIRAFGGRPTPHEQAIKQTLNWFRSG